MKKPLPPVLQSLRLLLVETRAPRGEGEADYQYGLVLGYLRGLVETQAISLDAFLRLTDMAESATINAREARHAA
ncbi:hypothetical protein [Halopseudomonas laoshanensis]|uniref:hypothetical protein n=1 Tax=Halopseudomonas laoshanensis TaxID=2268758 RepID=UPI0037350727